MPENEAKKDAALTVGGGSSQTTITEGAQGVGFGGKWGQIVLPWNWVIWGVQAIWGLFKKKA